jgi:selenocysteine lyase/cysteine desulfurase
MEVVRGKAAALLGCKLDELVLTNCTTEGMNWVAQGLSLAQGDRILTTDQEHPGGRVGWDFVAKRYGAAIDVVAIPPGENDPGAIVERFTKAIMTGIGIARVEAYDLDLHRHAHERLSALQKLRVVSPARGRSRRRC